MGYQVIVSYEHKLASGQNDLWAHIPYWWANKCKAEALIQEFEHRKQHGRPGNFTKTFEEHFNIAFPTIFCYVILVFGLYVAYVFETQISGSIFNTDLFKHLYIHIAYIS